MKKINLFNRNTNSPRGCREQSPLSMGKGCPVERGGVWACWRNAPRITPSPFGATPSWKEGERSGRCGLWFAALVALFVATPSFAEPTELDKKTVASKAYVDTKQDMIPAAEEDYQSVLTDTDNDGVVGKMQIVTSDFLDDNAFTLDDVWHTIPTSDAVFYELDNSWQPKINAKSSAISDISGDAGTLIAATDTNGVVSQRLIIPGYKHSTGNGELGSAMYQMSNGGNFWSTGDADEFSGMLYNIFLQNTGSAPEYELRYSVPSMELALDWVNDIKREFVSLIIPRSGYDDIEGDNPYTTNAATNRFSWLNAGVKGTGLVTKTATDGVVGERKIFETTDVANYHATGLTQIQKDIQDISIPTVGAMMTAIANGANAALPTGTTGAVVTYNGVNAETGVQEFSERAVYDPANAYNAQNDATKLATMASVKYVCAGYEAGHENDPDYCWLWTLPN